MSFLLIKGWFKPQAGIPDGDSVRFLAHNVELWTKLEGRQPVLAKGPKTTDTVQLRFEGIDSIEKGATKPLAYQARDTMFQLIGFDENDNPEPEGYVLVRMTDDKTGRPIAFVFAGTTRKQDGDEVFLDGPMLQKSVNYLQMRQGFAYPLYYNTLFASLREEFNRALAQARNDGLGYWPFDQTQAGVKVKTKADLSEIHPIWPKLWSRLETFLRNHDSLTGFIDFLEEKNERIDILPIMEERGLQDIVKVKNKKVSLTELPENIRVVGKAGQRKR